MPERKIGIVDNMNTALDLALNGAICLVASSKIEGPLEGFSDSVAYIGRRFASEKGAVPVAVSVTKFFLPRTHRESVEQAITDGMMEHQRKLVGQESFDRTMRILKELGDVLGGKKYE